MASSKLSLDSTVSLANSNFHMPRLGFGVYQAEGDECVAAVASALKTGYRHIDTAQLYENEAQVGQAVRESGLPRSELFITTKAFESSGGVEATYQRCLESVKAIVGPDGYVDLFLIHGPDDGPQARKELWLALEKVQADGKTRSIGVSNYGIGQIEEMKQFAKSWPPVINQIELHPWCQQREISEYCRTHNIILQAYSPLVQNTRSNDPTLLGVAQHHQVTPQQVLLRYALQKEWVPLPKSVTPARIEANRNLYGFELSDEDMKTLDGLDMGAAGALLEAVVNEGEPPSAK